MKRKSKAKILIVDDEEDICYLTKLMLEKEGYSVIVARSGNEGIEKAVKEKPDIMLLNIKLPDTNGWHVCKELKSRRETSDIVIAMFSARRRIDEEQGFSYAGCDCHYIEKPFTRDEIINAIEAMKDKKPVQIQRSDKNKKIT